MAHMHAMVEMASGNDVASSVSVQMRTVLAHLHLRVEAAEDEL